MKEITVDRPIIVEGKYDKIKLSSFIKSEIIVTNGFGFFSEADKRDYIKKVAEKNGIIILTDSDSAGMLIRNRIKDFVPGDKIVNLYIPQIKGKEKRKYSPSAEGTLGVEGIDCDILYSMFEKYSASYKASWMTPTDAYNLGLSGRPNSYEMREKVCEKFGLPKGLKAKGFIDAVNLLISKEELTEFLKSQEAIKNETC